MSPRGYRYKVNVSGQHICIILHISGQDQVSGFQIYGQTTLGGPEFLMYTETSGFYGDGLYDIAFPQVETTTIVIRRDGIITLCEVEVFGGMY